MPEQLKVDATAVLRKQLLGFFALWAVSLAVILGSVAGQIRSFGTQGVLIPILTAFTILLALFWLPGFGDLRARIESYLPGRVERASAIGIALLFPYVVYGAGTWVWGVAPAFRLIVLTVIPLGVYVAFPVRSERFHRQDAVVMLVLAYPIYAGWYTAIWSYPQYLDPMARLFAVSLGAFSVLSIRPLSGVGYEWRLRAGDWLEGLKQLARYMVIGLPLGFALHFIAWNPRAEGAASIVFSFVGIFIFVAVAEELFFRGMLQNLLEKSMSNPWAARGIASAIFGLSHIHHGFPNWRYVIMAAVAGWFYGTAWHNRRSIVASCVVHAGVDTIWRHFFTL